MDKQTTIRSVLLYTFDQGRVSRSNVGEGRYTYVCNIEKKLSPILWKMYIFNVNVLVMGETNDPIAPLKYALAFGSCALTWWLVIRFGHYCKLCILISHQTSRLWLENRTLIRGKEIQPKIMFCVKSVYILWQKDFLILKKILG